MLKREEHRRALVAAATSGSAAVLPRHRQRAACGAPEGARERLRRLLHRFQRARAYAEAFEAAGALDRLEAFASFAGADFYGMPRNTGARDACDARPGRCPRALPFGDAELKPLRGGETLAWRLVG